MFEDWRRRLTTRSIPRWIAQLARIVSAARTTPKFLGDLAMLADNDADDLNVRKALAEHHLEAGQPKQAEKWGNRMPLHRCL